MKIAFISDTHGLHHQLVLTDADVLVHAGDVSNSGKEHEIVDFLKWFGAKPHAHKIFIASNHDFFFEKESKQTIESIIPENVIYLNDSGVTINGIHF